MIRKCWILAPFFLLKVLRSTFRCFFKYKAEVILLEVNRISFYYAHFLSLGCRPLMNLWPTLHDTCYTWSPLAGPMDDIICLVCMNKYPLHLSLLTGTLFMVVGVEQQYATTVAFSHTHLHRSIITNARVVPLPATRYYNLKNIKLSWK